MAVAATELALALGRGEEPPQTGVELATTLTARKSNARHGKRSADRAYFPGCFTLCMTDDIARAASTRPATIYDVARAAGVSIATVSNVLNRPDRVGAATRERVIRAADELRYVPKSEAAMRARARATPRVAGGLPPT
jgi:Bacterial regulatory proteins, lacI family